MALSDDLQLLTRDLQQQRADLEMLMDESTKSSRTTKQLQQRIERLRKRIEAIQRGSEGELATQARATLPKVR